MIVYVVDTSSRRCKLMKKNSDRNNRAHSILVYRRISNYYNNDIRKIIHKKAMEN